MRYNKCQAYRVRNLFHFKTIFGNVSLTVQFDEFKFEITVTAGDVEV